MVCCPGGFGTMDEAMELLTLMQTGKHDLVPMVLLDEPGGTYWKGLQRFIEEELLGGGMISPEDVHLYKITDDVDEAVDEVIDFFRVYHSMRYVSDELVFRLKEPLSAISSSSLSAGNASRCWKSPSTKMPAKSRLIASNASADNGSFKRNTNSSPTYRML